MSDFLTLDVLSDDEMMYEGFLDGKQDLVPDNTELECVVTDAFIGVKEGEAVQVCFVAVSITTPGPYLGYKFKYNAKVFDVDAAKRDKAKKNLSLLDAQAGYPLGKGKLPLTTDNMIEHWSGVSFARVKIGVFVPDDETKSTGNYIQGFGFLREKMARGDEPKHEVKQADAPVGDDSDDVGF